jgi:DNA-binding transcriptional LysR family regulator
VWISKPAFTIEQLRSFLAVAEHENVSRAAASLHLTQGAVTQQIHHFERALGLRLFERTGRGVKLTDAGRALAITARAAQRGFEVVDDAVRAIKMLEAGSLHLGASPTCATLYLPQRLAPFTKRFPRVSLDIVVEPSMEISAKVRAGALDCGLIEGASHHDVVELVIARDLLVLVCRPPRRPHHPLASHRRVTPAQLEEHRYIGRGPAWGAEANVREMVGGSYDRLEILNLGHPEYVRAAALEGLGWAALPLLAVQDDLSSGVLKRLPGISGERLIRAIRRLAPGGPTLEEFWRHLGGSSLR